MNVAENIRRLNESLPKTVKLIAVSKTHPVDMIATAYNEAGQRLFGENKVQELIDKYNALPKDIEWHFIGHLQTNKVKFIAPFISLIHAVDSLKLLKEINKEALLNNRTINCLIQFHIGEEETKFGLSMNECLTIVNSEEFKQLKNVAIVGVMGMATYTDNIDQIKSEFNTLKSYFDDLKNTSFKEDNNFKELSMGMSDDYLIAIESGSTLIRVGSALFGNRTYAKEN